MNSDRQTFAACWRRIQFAIGLLVSLCGQSAVLSAQDQADVLVYGATPAGIAAAVAAAKDGQSVLLIEPTSRIGGLVTCGLSHTDFRTLEGLNGAFLDFSRRVEAYYARTYGQDSPQRRDSFHGTFGEPKVNLAVFESLLAEQAKITNREKLVLQAVQFAGPNAPRRIAAATFLGDDGKKVTLHARMFIDATYEGDLMAMAGVPWRAGREGRSEYDESLAPASGDDQLQAYNFRFIMTRDAANRVTPQAPSGYRREDFAAVLPAIEAGRIKKIFDYPKDCIFKAQTPTLPNGKYDINDVSAGFIRLSLPGQNLAWPNGNAAARKKVFDDHLRDQVGLLYFLQNDAAVPAKFRDEAREWGWCRDEFTETGHLPPQLYVREARRMQGVHVFTQHDSRQAPDDARSVRHASAIAMGDYGNNCHGTAHEGPRFGGKHTGEFYNSVPPYQIPCGVIVPRDVDNLLVPVAASSSHVGFCALRLEPIWMSLGQAAGHAAAIATSKQQPVQNVDVPVLQQRLHAVGSATIYVSDILPGHADFSAVQWWGTAGGLHGLHPPFPKLGQRGKNINSQYYEAYPGHAANLSQPLDAALAERWSLLAGKLGIAPDRLPVFSSKPTRGDFIREAWKQYRSANPALGDVAAITQVPVWKTPPGWTETIGGSGGKTIRVTTLAAQGAGSLAEALAMAEPRVIEFAVGGNIDLGGKSLRIGQANLTIAGETAPAPGITLINGGVGISTHDVIVRHIRIRPGAGNHTKKSGWEIDGLATGGGAHDVIIDHCSITWATDENLSASGPRFEGATPDEWRKNTSHRVTFNHCIIGEGLHDSTHAKGPHSKGSLIHDNASEIAIIGNLYISNDDRNPFFKGGARGVVVNNLIHNPGYRVMQFALNAGEWQGHEWQRGGMAIVGNVARKGASSAADVAFLESKGPCDVFLKDNVYQDAAGKPLPPVPKFRDMQSRLSTSDPKNELRVVDAPPHWPSRLKALPASETTEWVLANAGARPWDRDDTDRRLIEEAKSGGGKIINFESEAGK